MLILKVFLIVTVLGIVITLMSRSVYSASAELLVDAQGYNTNTVDAANPLSSIFVLSPPQSVETQVEVLQTQALLDEVMSKVGKAEIKADAQKDTNVIVVSAEAEDPKVAASAANTLLDLYLVQGNDQDLADMESALQFVKDQNQAARKTLIAAEEALKQFKLQNHLNDLKGDQQNEVTRVASMVAQRDRTRVDLARTEDQIQTSQHLLALEPPALMQQITATNTVIANLKDQARQLEVQRQGMIQPSGYALRSPEVQAIDARIADLKTRIAKEPVLTTTQATSPNGVRELLRSRMADLQVTAAASSGELQALERSLSAAQATLPDYTKWEVTLGRLTRERDAAATSSQMFASEQAQLSLRERAHHVTAHIIERAVPPLRPLHPKMQAILLVCFLGLALGISAALLWDFLDDRLNTSGDANRALNLPTLGHVPLLSATEARLLPQMTRLDPVGQSYRVLRTNIQSVPSDRPLHTLLVTSVAPGEGKTTVALNLAFAMAMNGKRVILVDADLRRPSLHHFLEVPASPGLQNVLQGEMPLSEVLLRHETIPLLSLLLAGSPPGRETFDARAKSEDSEAERLSDEAAYVPNDAEPTPQTMPTPLTQMLRKALDDPAEVLGSEAFRAVVRELSAQADLVILDSPPLLAAADAQILAVGADGVLLVVEAGETRKSAARQALTLLQHAHANVLGLVFNKMELREDGSLDYRYVAPDENAPKNAPGGSTNGKSASRRAPRKRTNRTKQEPKA